MTETKKTCFVAMPITTQDDEVLSYGDAAHWKHVLDVLFVPAVEASGFEVVRPTTVGSSLIHEVVIKQLENADLVLCDLSSQNPNVFFELGVRTSLDRPVALVIDEKTPIPFDVGGINTYKYQSDLPSWTIDADIESLRQHLIDAEASCAGRNPLWTRFGYTLRAQEPETTGTPVDAKLDLLVDRIPQIERKLYELTGLVEAASPKPQTTMFHGAGTLGSGGSIELSADQGLKAWRQRVLRFQEAVSELSVTHQMDAELFYPLRDGPVTVHAGKATAENRSFFDAVQAAGERLGLVVQFQLNENLPERE